MTMNQAHPVYSVVNFKFPSFPCFIPSNMSSALDMVVGDSPFGALVHRINFLCGHSSVGLGDGFH